MITNISFLKEKIEEYTLNKEPEKFEDKDGFGYICPNCKTKCYYQGRGLDGWICECKCGLLFDED